MMGNNFQIITSSVVAMGNFAKGMTKDDGTLCERLLLAESRLSCRSIVPYRYTHVRLYHRDGFRVSHGLIQHIRHTVARSSRP